VERAWRREPVILVIAMVGVKDEDVAVGQEEHVVVRRRKRPLIVKSIDLLDDSAGFRSVGVAPSRLDIESMKLLHSYCQEVVVVWRVLLLSV
jgi:hypothetical protein